MAATPKISTNKVSAVRFWSLGELTRVSIDVSGSFKYRSDRLVNPDRLFFDISGAKPELGSKGTTTIPVGDGILKQIRIAETQPGVTRVVLDLEQRAEFTAAQVAGPDRLVIELHGKDHAMPAKGKITEVTAAPEPVVPSSVKHPILVNEPRVLLEESAPASAPVLHDAKPEARKFEPPPHAAAPAQLASVVPAPEILSPPPMPALKPLKLPPVSFSSLKTELPPPPVGAAPKTEKTSYKGVAAEPAKRNMTGERSLTRVLGLKVGRVVIDPGHGGRDVGTHGPSGLYEKDVVLDVAMRLGTLIQDRMGSEVIYTRTDDTFVPLEERTRIANDRKADLFLSIHANSSPLRTAAGVEMYYLNFTTSKAALDVAARENASSSKSIYDLKDLIEKIALKDKVDESREFASRLQTSLSTIETKQNTGAKNRGLKKAPFIVLIGASMPSVLAEIGFLTNSGDEALLRKNEHRQKIAEALYKGIASYAETLSHFQVAKKGE